MALTILTALFALGWHGYRYVTDTGIDDVRGVDVSSYQLDVDWDVLKSEGIRFAFIKATEGSSHVDPNFEVNWKGAHRAGMLVGAYHFLSFDTDGDTQAENFIDTVKKKRNMLPPAVDIELYGDYSSDPPSADTVRGILDTVLEELEDRYDMKPILYVNHHVYGMYLADEAYADYPIWISDPDESDTLSDGRIWTFCQYSFSGLSDGVGEGKKVDLDKFRGNLWQLRQHDFEALE